MRAIRGNAPLLPTHGGSFTGRGNSWKPPKKRGSVFIKLMVGTFMIAACAYGGFAWAVLRRADTAQASSSSSSGRGLKEAHSDHHEQQDHEFQHHYDQHDDHHHLDVFQQQHAEKHHQQQREHQAWEAAEHARITRERNARSSGGAGAGHHGSMDHGALHEASGDLHHGGHGTHQMQGGHGSTHQEAVHEHADQLAADRQHQADIRQQEELTDAHAPVTDPPATHTASHTEAHATVHVPSHLSTEAHAPVITHATHLEAEQVIPKHTPEHQQAATESPVAAVVQPAAHHDLRTNEADLHAPVTAPVDTPKHTEHAPVHAAPVAQADHVAPVVDTSVHPQATHLPHPPPQQHQQAEQPAHQQQQEATQHVVATPVAATGLYALTAVDADGVSQPLSKYAGQVTLVVNVASQCGYTDENYKGLKALYDKYHIHGLEVLAFPCNQFGSQEPGTEAEIKEFCSTRYHTAFPIFSKVEVNGPNAHAVFKYLKSHTPVDEAEGAAKPEDDIGWNFFKFLVDRSGTPIKRWNQRWNQVSVEREVYAALVHKAA